MAVSRFEYVGLAQECWRVVLGRRPVVLRGRSGGERRVSGGGLGPASGVGRVVGVGGGVVALKLFEFPSALNRCLAVAGGVLGR